MDRDEHANESEKQRASERERETDRADDRENQRDRDDQLRADERADERDRDLGTNPPRTTTGRMTSPKFGSATSGGGEFEPGPERD